MNKAKSIELSRKDFPDDFLFGSATSSYQIEGHKYGKAGKTHWDTFAETPGNVKSLENGSIACDHYHRYEEDFDILKNGGFDAYRFSISWARVMPEGKGKVNQEGLDFYDRLIDSLLEKKLNPFATMYHWELPSAIADLGGWVNRDIANYFQDFVQVMAEKMKDRVDFVAPINEPWCVAWLSHFLGHHAPGLRDVRATVRAMHHVLLAHGKAIQTMKEAKIKYPGAVFNMEYPKPASDSPEDKEATEIYHGIYNQWFIGAVLKKQYPAHILKLFEPHMPKNWEDDMEVIGEKISWIGLNYYTRKVISFGDSGSKLDLVDGAGDLPKTTMGWEVYPEGLGKMLKMIKDEYSNDLPIYITENGMSGLDEIQNNIVEDTNRISYLQQHLQTVKKAIKEGVNVKGYFVWSLLDNFEWALGYEKRFGLVHVDFKTLARTPKDSYFAMQKMLTESK